MAAGETIEFDVGTGPDGKARAINLKQVAGRTNGVIKSFDHRKGFGFIAAGDESPDVFFHFSGLLGDGVKTTVEGEAVEFETVEGKHRLQAVKIKRLDPRLPLFKFAMMGQDFDWPKALRTLAENEDWDGRRAAITAADGSGPRHPILRSYLIYTFARLKDEGKIAMGSTNGHRFACFNTGLVTPLQEEIFALFEESRADSPSPWRLTGFHARSDRMLLVKFDKLPLLANYFDDPSVLLYDRRKELCIDVPHILQDNLGRFPESCRNNEYLARQLLESARAATQQRVYRNYKTAIPQFHRGEVQLLLPLCLERPDRADLALVVSRVGEQYRGDTVLTLEMAYNNARLLTRPDREWLLP